jgi:hypothetical protein
MMVKVSTTDNKIFISYHNQVEDIVIPPLNVVDAQKLVENISLAIETIKQRQDVLRKEKMYQLSRAISTMQAEYEKLSCEEFEANQR